LFPFRQNMTTIVLHRKMSGSISAESGVQELEQSDDAPQSRIGFINRLGAGLAGGAF
jgi:hypothetical protein